MSRAEGPTRVRALRVLSSPAPATVAHQRSRMSTDDVLRRAAPTMMSAEELSCSVCYELPTGEVHQCSRGHFLCVSCWNDIDKLPSRVCPECRVPLPRANRCRVAELAIKHLPRPDGYTTPPPVRPNNRGQQLTPLLEGSEGSLEEKLLISEAKVVSLEICLVEEIAARNEEARLRMELEEKQAQLEQELKEATKWTSSRSDAAMRIAVVATQERDAMATRLAALERAARSPLRWVES